MWLRIITISSVLLCLGQQKLVGADRGNIDLIQCSVEIASVNSPPNENPKVALLFSLDDKGSVFSNLGRPAQIAHLNEAGLTPDQFYKLMVGWLAGGRTTLIRNNNAQNDLINHLSVVALGLMANQVIREEQHGALSFRWSNNRSYKEGDTVYIAMPDDMDQNVYTAFAAVVVKLAYALDKSIYKTNAHLATWDMNLTPNPDEATYVQRNQHILAHIEASRLRAAYKRFEYLAPILQKRFDYWDREDSRFMDYQILQTMCNLSESNSFTDWVLYVIASWEAADGVSFREQWIAKLKRIHSTVAEARQNPGDLVETENQRWTQLTDPSYLVARRKLQEQVARAPEPLAAGTVLPGNEWAAENLGFEFPAKLVRYAMGEDALFSGLVVTATTMPAPYKPETFRFEVREGDEGPLVLGGTWWKVESPKVDVGLRLVNVREDYQYTEDVFDVSSERPERGAQILKAATREMIVHAHGASDPIVDRLARMYLLYLKNGAIREIHYRKKALRLDDAGSPVFNVSGYLQTDDQWPEGEPLPLVFDPKEAPKDWIPNHTKVLPGNSRSLFLTSVKITAPRQAKITYRRAIAWKAPNQNWYTSRRSGKGVTVEIYSIDSGQFIDFRTPETVNQLVATPELGFSSTPFQLLRVITEGLFPGTVDVEFRVSGDDEINTPLLKKAVRMTKDGFHRATMALVELCW